MGSQPVKKVAEQNSLKIVERDSWNFNITSNDSWRILEEIAQRIRDNVLRCTKFFWSHTIWFLKRQSTQK